MMTKLKGLLVALFFVIHLHAQTDSAEIRKTIVSFFDAMQNADTLKLRFLFHPSARLQTVFHNKMSRQNELRNESTEEFLEQVAEIKKDTSLHVEERLLDWKILSDGLLASVWTPYEFYINNTRSHTGVNVFQLFRAADGWKIIQISDTRKREKQP